MSALPIDPEVQRELDEHKKILSEHGEDIQGLKVDTGILKEQLNNLTSQMNKVENVVTRVETSVLASNNSTTQMCMQMMMKYNDNETKVLTETNKNQTQLSAKKIGLYGTMITGFIGLASLIVKVIWG